MHAFAQVKKATQHPEPAKATISHPSAARAIQTTLAVNAPGERYEQDARCVAEQVMRTPERQLPPACPCGGGRPNCDTEQPGRAHERLQTQHARAGNTGQIAAPPIVQEVLRSSGQPLDRATRAFMEPRFGYDFSEVRVHSDRVAEQSARALNANAYTVRHNIVFAAGKLAPDTRQGRQLLAHELAHVVQQNDGMAVIQREPGDELEPLSRPASRAAYQRYLDTLRETMAKPAVADPELAKIVEKLYRDHPEVGSGSTGAAIRQELATGMPTKGTRHLQAGHERMTMLKDWLNGQKELAKKLAQGSRGARMPVAPGALASARDVAIAEHLFLDLQEAVHSGYYAEFEINVTPPPGGAGGKVNPESPAAPTKTVEPPTAPSKATARPESPATTLGAQAAPKGESRFRARLSAAKGGFVMGIKHSFSAPNLASMIPEAVLAIADKVAAREAIRVIQVKFVKEGFSKGVAAGLVGWEASSELKNRVTSYRVKGMADPAGILKLAHILQLAEAYENYGADVGYQFSSSKPKPWKDAMRAKGFAALAHYGYHFGEDPRALLEYGFIDKLAGVLRSATDPIVEQAIEKE